MYFALGIREGRPAGAFGQIKLYPLIGYETWYHHDRDSDRADPVKREEGRATSERPDSARGGGDPLFVYYTLGFVNAKKSHITEGT